MDEWTWCHFASKELTGGKWSSMTLIKECALQTCWLEYWVDLGTIQVKGKKFCCHH